MSGLPQDELAAGAAPANVLQRDYDLHAARPGSRAKQQQRLQIGQLKHDTVPASDQNHGPHQTRQRDDHGDYGARSDERGNYHDDLAYDSSFESVPSSQPRPVLTNLSVKASSPLLDSLLSPRWDSLVNRPSAALYGHIPSSNRYNSFPRTGYRPGPSTALPSKSVSPEYPQREDPRGPGYEFPPLRVRDVPRPALTPTGSDPFPFPTTDELPDLPDVRPSTATGGSMTVENFSRPRKPSIKNYNNHESSFPRERTLYSTPSEPTLYEQAASATYQINTNPNFPLNTRARPRGYSGSSGQSTSTFSSLPHRPSNDYLNGTFRSSSRTDSLRYASPAASNSVKPPLVLEDGISHYTREHLHWRSAPDDQLRSSFQSQDATSIEPAALSAVEAERTRVQTRTSSITASLIINNYARVSRFEGGDGDEGPSVEDVMAMYVDGFADDSDVEESHDNARKRELKEERNDTTELDMDRDLVKKADSTSPSVEPLNTNEMATSILEAMGDPLPIPEILEMQTPDYIDNSVMRNSAAFFKIAGLSSSFTRDMGLEALSNSRLGIEDKELAKHDSAKVVDGEGDKDEDEDEDEDEDDNEVAVIQGEKSNGGSNVEQVPETSPTSSPSSSPETTISMSPIPAQPTQPAQPAQPAQLPEEPEEEPGNRDRYGFRKANAYITREQYDAWDGPYTEYLARRRRKWTAFLKDNSLMTENPNRFPQPSSKTKRFVRKGIPPEWRGAAWFYYAGGPAILSKHRGMYDHLVKRAGLDLQTGGKADDDATELKPLVVDDIEKDLHRTFPDNIRFKPPARAASCDGVSGSPREESRVDSAGSTPDMNSSKEIIDEPKLISSLRRVLHAFALYNPRIGYCQSLNFLAGLLLLFVETEEQAFWLLNVITRVYLPGTHEMSLEGSKVDLGVLMVALKDSLPSVWKQIAADEADEAAGKRRKGKRGKEPPVKGASAVITNDPNRLPAITLCMTSWFMSCFIGTLPIETVLRVWDVFFYEGSRTLFRIALAIFKAGESEIKGVADPMEMFGVVQTLPRRMLDCNALLEACYKRRNGIGHLTQEVVEERRQARRDGIRRWKAEQDAVESGKDGNNNGRSTATTVRKETSVTTRLVAAGLDLAGRTTDSESADVRRKGTLFGRRKDRDREQARAAEVV